MTSQSDKSRKLMEIAKICLEDEEQYCIGIEDREQYCYGIEACNEVLDGGCAIDSLMKHDCLCTRAALLLKV